MEFNKLFSVKKPLIGMIHLAGDKPIKRALEELLIYEEQEIDGAIIENYHAISDYIPEVLKESYSLNLKIIKGVNVLRNPYTAFNIASNFDAKFIQFDSIQTPDLNLQEYEFQRKKYPNIYVLGGVGFKYLPPTGNPLKKDLDETKPRCEAIVTTGTGTGIETPIRKLKQYKELLKDFPLIVGAGVNKENVYEQLKITNGAIIGSAFKVDNNTHNKLDIKKIKDIVDIVKTLR